MGAKTGYRLRTPIGRRFHVDAGCLCPEFAQRRRAAALEVGAWRSGKPDAGRPESR